MPKFLSLKLYNEITKKMISWKDYRSMYGTEAHSVLMQKESMLIQDENLQELKYGQD
jgi:hypothetical protein